MTIIWGQFHTKFRLEISYLQFHLKPPGANELSLLIRTPIYKLKHNSRWSWTYTKNCISIFSWCKYLLLPNVGSLYDDVIKWKHFPRYWPFVRGIHRSPVNSPHKGQWRGALMFSLIYPRINGWVNNREAGDLRRHRAHYDVIVLIICT